MASDPVSVTPTTVDAGSEPVRKRRLHARTAAYLKSQLVDRTAAELAIFLKGLVVAAVTIVPVMLSVIVISKAMIENSVVMTALRVPQFMEEAGYTSEAATQRLLDEIAALNRNSNAAKPKTALGDTQLIDALSAIETPAGSLDLKSFQSLIQRVLGKKIVQISGEITMRNEGDVRFLRLRLRQTPGRESLIDVETAAGPEDLFRKSALNLLEHIDPEIAAGIYFREYGDEETAMRLTAVAIGGDFPEAEKYAHNLRTYIYLRRGQVGEAAKSSDRARTLDPDFVAADYTRAFVLLAQKRLDEALEAARRAVQRAPDSDNSYSTLGVVLNAAGRKEEAVEAYRMALRKNTHSSGAYRRLVAILLSMGRGKEASDTVLQAVAALPESALIQLDYGKDLQRQGRMHEALTSLRKAYAIQPDNLQIQLALAEVELGHGHTAEAKGIAVLIRKRIDSGGRLTNKIKPQAEALLSRVEMKDAEAAKPDGSAR